MAESQDYMEITFPGLPENESLARVCVSAFAIRLNPTLDVIADVKTAVSEAVTNAIVHGYAGTMGAITLRCDASARDLCVTVTDAGCGIEDIPKAMEPFYTSQPGGERSGMGFAVMKTFMDEVSVLSAPGEGTTVRMRKRIPGGD